MLPLFSTRLPLASVALLWILLQTLLLQTSFTEATLQGSVVVPMGANLPPIEISFLHREGEEVDLYIIQSHGLSSTDNGFFKVEGPLDCVRLVSQHQVIISGVAMGTAMNHQNFFRVGDTILLAVSGTDKTHPGSEVSVINRIPHGQTGDCWDPDWTDFTLLRATEGQINVDIEV